MGSFVVRECIQNYSFKIPFNADETLSFIYEKRLTHLLKKIKDNSDQILLNHSTLNLKKTEERRLRLQIYPVKSESIQKIIRTVSYLFTSNIGTSQQLMRIKIPDIGSVTIDKKAYLIYLHYKKYKQPLFEGANNIINSSIQLDFKQNKYSFLVERTSLSPISSKNKPLNFYEKNPEFNCKYIDQKPITSYFYYGNKKINSQKTFFLKRCSLMQFYAGDYVSYVSQYHRHPQFEAMTLLKIFFMQCLAVSHIQKYGFSHKDIKPQNIAINYSEQDINKVESILIDLDDVEFPSKTFTSGSFGFIPKNLDQEQNHQADIFSLGSFLYMILQMIRSEFQDHFEKELLEKLNKLSLSMRCESLEKNPTIYHVIDKILSIFNKTEKNPFQELYQEHQTQCLHCIRRL